MIKSPMRQNQLSPQSQLVPPPNWMEIESPQTIKETDDVKVVISSTSNHQKRVYAKYVVQLKKQPDRYFIVSVECTQNLIGFKDETILPGSSRIKQIKIPHKEHLSFEKTMEKIQAIVNDTSKKRDEIMRYTVLLKCLDAITRDIKKRYYIISDIVQSQLLSSSLEKNKRQKQISDYFKQEFENHPYYSTSQEESKENHQFLYIMQTSCTIPSFPEQSIIKIGKTIQKIRSYERDLFKNYQNSISFEHMVYFEIPCDKDEKTTVDQRIHRILKEENSESKIYLEGKNLHVEFFLLDRHLFLAIKDILFNLYSTPYQKDDKDTRQSLSRSDISHLEHLVSSIPSQIKATSEGSEQSQSFTSSDESQSITSNRYNTINNEYSVAEQNFQTIPSGFQSVAREQRVNTRASTKQQEQDQNNYPSSYRNQTNGVFTTRYDTQNTQYSIPNQINIQNQQKFAQPQQYQGQSNQYQQQYQTQQLAQNGQNQYQPQQQQVQSNQQYNNQQNQHQQLQNRMQQQQYDMSNPANSYQTQSNQHYSQQNQQDQKQQYQQQQQYNTNPTAIQQSIPSQIPNPNNSNFMYQNPNQQTIYSEIQNQKIQENRNVPNINIKHDQFVVVANNQIRKEQPNQYSITSQINNKANPQYQQNQQPPSNIKNGQDEWLNSQSKKGILTGVRLVESDYDFANQSKKPVQFSFQDRTNLESNLQQLQLIKEEPNHEISNSTSQSEVQSYISNMTPQQQENSNRYESQPQNINLKAPVQNTGNQNLKNNQDSNDKNPSIKNTNSPQKDSPRFSTYEKSEICYEERINKLTHGKPNQNDRLNQNDNSKHKSINNAVNYVNARDEDRDINEISQIDIKSNLNQNKDDQQISLPQAPLPPDTTYLGSCINERCSNNEDKIIKLIEHNETLNGIEENLQNILNELKETFSKLYINDVDLFN